MADQRNTYEINGTVYELLPPVFGVLRHVNLFCDEAGSEVETVDDLRAVLADRTGEFVAGFLTPQGTHPADRDMDAIARDIDWAADGQIPFEVIESFFSQPGFDPGKIKSAGQAMLVLGGMIMTDRAAKQAPGPGEKDEKQSTDTSVS